MDKFIRGPIEMSWNPGTRLAVLRFERKVHLTGEDAAALVEALSGWIGKEGKPFGLLGDGGKLSGLDADYRAIMGKFFQQHRKDSYLAFFNMNPVVRVAAEMFHLGTGLNLKGFAEEEEALSWLQEMGIKR